MDTVELYFFPKPEHNRRFGLLPPYERRFLRNPLTNYFIDERTELEGDDKSIQYKLHELKGCKEDYIYILEGFEKYVFNLLEIKQGHE